MSPEKQLCKIQLITRFLAPALIIAVVITMAFVLFYKPEILKQPLMTRLTITYSPQKIVPGETVTIKGTLEYYTNPWLPFPNQDVSLYYAPVKSDEWTLFGTTVTDERGQFIYIWIVKLPPGEYKMKAVYAGDEGYQTTETEIHPAPQGLLVIPETQHGIVAALTCMLITIFAIKIKKELSRALNNQKRRFSRDEHTKE